jgi:tetratricopeptide (TPR) repeat protein
MKTAVLTIFFAFAIGMTSIAQTDSADYYFRLGQAAKSAGRTAVAYEHFEKAIHFKPSEAYFRKPALRPLNLGNTNLRDNILNIFTN